MDNGPKTHSVCLPTPCQKPVDTMAGPEAAHQPADAKIDAEFAKFARIAKPMADGTGWFDPTQEPVPVGGYVPSERPAGVPRDWSVDGWGRHLRYMGNACAALNPEKSSEYLNKAKQLEDCCNV